MNVNLANPNALEVSEEISSQSQKYKQGYMNTWKLNLTRLSGDYEADLREEDQVFGRVGQRRFNHGTKRRRGLHAVIALANPKMHHSIARQVNGAQNFSAIPTSHKRNDRFRAKATTQMLKARQHEQGGQDYESAYKLGLLLKCALPGFMLVEGDRNMPRKQALNSPDSTKRETGDVRLAALPAWRVHWEPGVEHVEDWTYCMVDQYMSPFQINERWPGPDNEKILNDTDIYHIQTEHDPLLALERGIEDSVIKVSRIFIRPNLRFPNGAQWITIGDTYVKKVYKDNRQDKQEWESSPTIIERVSEKVQSTFGLKKTESLKDNEQWIGTPDNALPIVRFGGLPSSPTTLGLGQMDLIGPLQRLANRKFTAYTEISNTTPDFNVLLPEKSQVDKYHNDVVFIDRNRKIGGAGFEIHARPSLTPILEEIGWLDSMIDQMLNQPGASRGEIPGTRTSGRAIQESKEGAAVAATPENTTFFISMAAVNRRIVLEGREVWPATFMHQAIGETRILEMKEFKKADLSGVVDIAVSRDDPWPTDKFQRARAIKEFATNGGFGDVMNDPKARKRMEDAMRLPSDEDDERHNHFQEQMLERHMQALKKSEDVSISFAADDEYHIMEEAEFLAEMIAEEDPAATEEYQNRVALHIILHHINAARKNKWSSIGKLTDQAVETIKAQTALENLAPEERLAVAQVQSAEETSQQPIEAIPNQPALGPAPAPDVAAL